MRNRGPSKQRLWLGSCRYPCCGGRRYTDANAHCYSDGDPHANSQPHCNSIGNGHAATDANTQVRTIRKAAADASAQAIDFALPKFLGVVAGIGDPGSKRPDWRTHRGGLTVVAGVSPASSCVGSGRNCAFGKQWILQPTRLPLQLSAQFQLNPPVQSVERRAKFRTNFILVLTRLGRFG